MAVSQRDVPGWTRATLPLLRKHGIIGVSFGAGTPPGKPDVPPLCVWRDSASGAEVVLTYETGYGGDSTLFVLPNGVALAVAWQVSRVIIAGIRVAFFQIVPAIIVRTGGQHRPRPAGCRRGFLPAGLARLPGLPHTNPATWFVSHVAVCCRAPRYPLRHSTISSRLPTSRRSRPSCPS